MWEKGGDQDNVEVSGSDNFMVGEIPSQRQGSRKRSHMVKGGQIMNSTLDILKLRCLCDILMSRRQCSIEV